MSAASAWAAEANRPILLLGRDGLLGSALARHLGALAGSGVPLVALGRRGEPSLDLSDRDAIRTTVHRLRPRLIVNAAAFTAVDGAEAEPALAWAVNAMAPGVLAEAAAALGAGLVHYSTDHVFDGAGGAPWPESAPTNPPNAYGRGKLAGEQAVQRSGCAHLILRTAWLHGPVQRGFVWSVLAQARRGAALEVVDDQLGNPTAAEWLAQASVQAITAWQRDAGLGGLYHLCSAGAASRLGFARQVVESAQALGLLPAGAAPVLRGVSTASRPSPAQRPPDARLDCSRFAGIFGLQLPPWQVGVEQTLAALRDAENRTHIR